MTKQSPASATDEIIGATRMWIERAVIGLNLCPFAKAVHADNRIRYRASEARTPEILLDELADELQDLKAADPAVCETTLLIAPYVLNDFLEYNDFLGPAEAAVAALGLTSEFQIASFHPRYQFAGTQADDIQNYTNRSPYPILHLLRESSIERAVAAMPEAAGIYERNIATLSRLGQQGWRRLWPPTE